MEEREKNNPDHSDDAELDALLLQVRQDATAQIGQSLDVRAGIRSIFSKDTGLESQGQ